MWSPPLSLTKSSIFRFLARDQSWWSETRLGAEKEAMVGAGVGPKGSETEVGLEIGARCQKL